MHDLSVIQFRNARQTVREYMNAIADGDGDLAWRIRLANPDLEDMFASARMGRIVEIMTGR